MQDSILVPFSPESPLSGVRRQLKPGELLRYRRRVLLPLPRKGRRLLLHFGAVDQQCRVLIDGKETGAFPVTGTLEEPPLAFLTPHGILNNLELKHIATAHPGKKVKSIVRQGVSPPSHTSAVFRREIQARGPMP